MPDGTAQFDAATARIGPNAILQLDAPLEAALGPGAMAHLLDLSGVPKPTGRAMVLEDRVARVHRALWQHFPDHARAVSEAAGEGTARYIRAHRIPTMARLALRYLPRALSERLLTKAISDHAWTFCGSGQLCVEYRDAAIHFILARNPLACDRIAAPHLCHWHSAVFAGLFSGLLRAPYHCIEESCCGCGGDTCRFVLQRGQKPLHFKGLQL